MIQYNVFYIAGSSSDTVLPPGGNCQSITSQETSHVKSLKHLMLITSEKSKPKRMKKLFKKKNTKSRKQIQKLGTLKQGSATSPAGLYDGCARTSIDGWAWHNRVRSSHPSERVQRNMDCINGADRPKLLNRSSSSRTQKNTQAARTNRAQLRQLAAAAEGSDIIKLPQLKVYSIIYSPAKIYG